MAEEEYKPKSGDVVSYTKEIDAGVIDENGERIPCKDINEAKMFSLLFEIKSDLKKLLKEKK